MRRDSTHRAARAVADASISRGPATYRVLVAVAAAALLCALPAFGQIERVRAAQLQPDRCVDGQPRVVLVVDSSSIGTCAPGSTGTAEALCCCLDGTWASCAADTTGYVTGATVNQGLTASLFPITLGLIDCAAGEVLKRDSGDTEWECAADATGGGGSGDIESVWGCASGDCSTLTAASGDSLDAGSADASSPATRSTSLPGSCAEGQWHHDTDSGGSEVYVCTEGDGPGGSADTWTKLTTASDIIGVTLDLDDDASNESTGLTEIASIHDPFGVLSESSADKLLVDADRIEQKYVHGPPASPNAMNCEFSGSICSWTAVSPTSSGTIDPYLTTDTSIYDTSTRPGVLLIQTGNDTAQGVRFAYNYVPADGEALYARVSVGTPNLNNNFDCGISLSQNSGGPRDGSYMNLYVDSQTGNQSRILFWAASEIGDIEPTSGRPVVLALARVAGDPARTYRAWASLDDGESWTHVGTRQSVNPVAYSWVHCSVNTNGSPVVMPIASFDWVRLGSNNVYAPGW